jgi:hypothetical protein
MLLIHDYFTNHGSTPYGPDLNRLQENEKLNNIKNLIYMMSSTQVFFLRRNHRIKDPYSLKPVLNDNKHVIDHM